MYTAANEMHGWCQNSAVSLCGLRMSVAAGSSKAMPCQHAGIQQRKLQVAAVEACKLCIPGSLKTDFLEDGQSNAFAVLCARASKAKPLVWSMPSRSQSAEPSISHAARALS